MQKKFLKHDVLDIGVKIFHLLNCRQINLLGHIYSGFLELTFVIKKSFGGRKLYKVQRLCIWNFCFCEGYCHFAHSTSLHLFSIVYLSFLFILSLISFPCLIHSTCYPFPIFSYYLSSPIYPFLSSSSPFSLITPTSFAVLNHIQLVFFLRQTMLGTIATLQP